MRTQFILLLSAFAPLTINAGAAINKQLSGDMLDLVDYFGPNPTTSAVLVKLRQIFQVLKNVPEKVKIKIVSLREAVDAAREWKTERTDKWLIAMLFEGKKGHRKLYKTGWTPDRIFSRFSLHNVKDKKSHHVYPGYSKYFDQWKEWNEKRNTD